MRAAADERLTMAPPVPPCFVDIRRSASRAQRKLPRMLTSNMRRSRATLIVSTRAPTSITPALLTRPASGGSSASRRAYIASTWASSATSACTASARPPACRMAWHTTSAAAASRA
jgi:hypothetical protein